MIRRPVSHAYPLPPLKINYLHDHAIDMISSHLTERINIYGKADELVVLCIGTDRSTGDALGPLVGTQLKKLFPTGAPIYGTIDEPVHAVNLKETIERMESLHPNSLVIAIDACLGKYSSVGFITVADGPVKPGAGIKKELPEVGTFHITGIVNIGGFMEYVVLQNTRLSIVMKMSEVIARSLYLSIGKLNHNRYLKSSTAY